MVFREGNLPIVVRCPAAAVLTDYILVDDVHIPVASAPSIAARPESSVCVYRYRTCRFGITLRAMLVI